MPTTVRDAVRWVAWAVFAPGIVSHARSQQAVARTTSCEVRADYFTPGVVTPADYISYGGREMTGRAAIWMAVGPFLLVSVVCAGLYATHTWVLDSGSVWMSAGMFVTGVWAYGVGFQAVPSKSVCQQASAAVTTLQGPGRRFVGRPVSWLFDAAARHPVAVRVVYPPVLGATCGLLGTLL